MIRTSATTWARAAVLAFTLAALFALAWASPARAATFIVDSSADAVDATPGDGTCATAVNECTLRAAIQEANALVGDDSIDFSVDEVTLSIIGAGEDSAATGDLDLRQDVIIDGGEGGVDIHTASAFDDRVFTIFSPASVNMESLTVRGGVVVDGIPSGGGILVLTGATLDLADSTVSDNTVSSSTTSVADGGGIFNRGTLTMTNSTVSGNTVFSSTVGGAFGGGVFNHNVGTATLTNSTVSGNAASNSGAGSSFGGGVFENGSATLGNTIVANNSAAEGPDVRGGFDSQG
ncbi:MAG: CSLREA domain-containing protein, partial [Rubrobacteraceae bacterium]